MERIYKKLTDVRYRQNKASNIRKQTDNKPITASFDYRQNRDIANNNESYLNFKNENENKSVLNCTESMHFAHSSKSSIYAPEVDLARHASYSSSHTTTISQPNSDFSKYKSPSVSYLPIHTKEGGNHFTSVQYDKRSELDSSQTFNLKNVTFKANMRKNSVDPKTRKQMLSRNNYYNDRILRTLLRSQSNNLNTSAKKPGSTYRTAAQNSAIISNKQASSTYYDNGELSETSSNATQVLKMNEQATLQYKTHHNMPIHSKITKGIRAFSSNKRPFMESNPQPESQKSKLLSFKESNCFSKGMPEQESKSGIMSTDFKPTARSRIIPNSNVGLSNTAYSRQ